MRNDSIGLFWEDRPPEKPVKVEKVKRTPPEPTWLRHDYLPYLEESIAFNVQQMSDQEIIQCAINQDPCIFDVECYVNYFLVAFKSQVTGKVFYFEKTATHTFNIEKLRWVMQNMLIVGFNSYGYDVPIVTLAVNGCSCEQLKQASDDIIVYHLRQRDLFKKYSAKRFQGINHIDIMEVGPGVRISLKTYGGRLHTKRMQDLPFVPNTVLSEQQIAITRYYCINDLDQTIELYNALEKDIILRQNMSEEYGVDLRSKSDAQVAEAVIGAEMQRMTGMRPYKPEIPVGTSYKYNVPSYLNYFSTPLMCRVMDIVRRADFCVIENGSIGMPQELASLRITLGSSTYKLGIGGLHSTESSVSHRATKSIKLIDRDVTSYYPFIILNQQLYPKHLGVGFLTVYRKIVDRRIHAKQTKDKRTADSLKIVINGSFGKLGSKYSILYSPDLMVQVTITGQLSLLLLIEKLELAGIPVVSGNTDGIVIKCPIEKETVLNQIVKWWEGVTGFETEDTEYLGVYSRDVNSYVAVVKKQENGKWIDEPDSLKTKGALAEAGLKINPASQICVDAIQQLLLKGTPVQQTIVQCTDIRQFLNVRNVSGGAVKVWDRKVPPHATKEELLTTMGFFPFPANSSTWGHESWNANVNATTERAYEHALAMCPAGETEYLGKAIRWYYGTNIKGEIVAAKNGNKVPRSDGAVPLMQLPDKMPGNVDFNWYIQEAYKLLQDCGYS